MAVFQAGGRKEREREREREKTERLPLLPQKRANSLNSKKT